MVYVFDTAELGRCQLVRQTSGKHGFGLPKVFKVRTLEQPEERSRTYKYVDNRIIGVQHVSFTDELLCRIAIAQFLQTYAEPVGNIELLDTRVLPFAGHVPTKGIR